MKNISGVKSTSFNMVIRYYEPNSLINLYDVNKHQNFNGVLYLRRQKKKLDLLKSINLRKIEKSADFIFDKVYADLLILEKKHQLIQRLALGLISLSVVGFALVISPLLFSFISNKIPLATTSSTKKTPTIKNIENKVAVADTIQQVKEFDLYIPKIDLSSEITSNVDLNNEKVYQQQLLDKGVLHANGSYLPGQGGLIFLFAHSTDSVADILNYNAKFFYINNLEKGDEIDLSFNGKQYQYIVTGKKVVNPEDIDQVRKSGVDLVLSTCWPLGTDWQRLLIFSRLKG